MSTRVEVASNGEPLKVINGAAKFLSGAGDRSTLLAAVSATGAGAAAQLVSSQMSVQVIITNTATVKLEVSNDGVNYVDLIVGITSSGMYTVTGPFLYIRANVTEYTSGTVSVEAVQ